MNCVACGEHYEDKGRFCSFCGIVLHVACTHCGHLNDRSQKVCSRCSRSLAGTQDLPEKTPAALAAGRPLERRQLTIMFTDLVNSTTLSDSMDPEDFRILIEAHRTAAAAPIKRYDGVVARYLGDGMLIYFGYPEAHEDDPDRAVRAGLEIVDATKAMNERWVGEGQGKIAVRIGIHTGIVVVGDVIKQDVQEPMAVFGNPPSMAARLQALAEPNSVVLSHATKALLRPTVRCLPCGQTTLKGITKPVEIYTASESKGRSISDPATDRRRNVLPFVNRQKELAALRLGWASAKKSKGKAFLLAGDPGIGKSRLIRALEERVVSKPFRWLVARTSPYATNSDFFAFSELFHGLLQPSAPENTEAKGYALLKSVLAEQGITDPNHGLGFAHLFGIGIPEDTAPYSLRPERLRDLTLGAITAWFEQTSADEPLVLVIEDLHWADASTLETIKLLLTKLASCRILLVMSSRDHGVLADRKAQVQIIPIERLPPDYAKILLDHVVHEAGLSDASVETLLERAAGVPLYLEELPKPVLEGGDGGGRPAGGLSRGGDPIALPATLRDSLMAQLDRMGVGKSVAQTGAVLGHSFEEALLRRVWGGGTQHLQEGLDALTEAGLLTRHGTSPEATYAFKHALLAEIAYDSLLRQECRQIHRRTADALVAHFPALTDTRPELIARHYAAARDAIVAFDYWMKAGKAAARRSANTEAIGHLRSAEAELETLKTAGAKDLDERWLALYMARAPVLVALFGWATPDVEQTYRDAWRLSRSSPVELHDKFAALGGLYNVYLLRGELEKAREINEQEHQMASELGYEDVLPKWHSGAGYCDFLGARFESARAHMDDVVRLYNSSLQTRHTVIYGIHPAVIANSAKALSEWFLGRATDAEKSISAAMATAKEAAHPFSVCYALSFAASLAQLRDQKTKTLALADQAFTLSVEHAFSYWIGWSSVLKGWALSQLGERENGLSILRDGLERYLATGAAQMQGYMLCLLADIYHSVSRYHDAAKASAGALSEMERTGIVFYQPEAYRLFGKSIGHVDHDQTRSLGAMIKAFRVAEQQRSLPLQQKALGTLLPVVDRRRLRDLIMKRARRNLRTLDQEFQQCDLDQFVDLGVAKQNR